MYRKLRKQGLLVVGINEGDDAKAIAGAIRKDKITFPIVMNGKDAVDMVEKYDVGYARTTYLLDPNGKVVALAAKCSEPGLQEALKKMGFRLSQAKSGG